MGYPNEMERRRLERFPDRIAVEDLRACFALKERDRTLVFEQRGPENRLGLAVSLSALRFLGFVPDDVASTPDEALTFLAGRSTRLRMSCSPTVHGRRPAVTTWGSCWRISVGVARMTAIVSDSRGGCLSGRSSTTSRRR